MYGRVDEYLLDDLPDIVLEHKIDMCRLLLQVLDVIEPGCSRIRGNDVYVPAIFIVFETFNIIYCPMSMSYLIIYIQYIT